MKQQLKKLPYYLFYLFSFLVIQACGGSSSVNDDQPSIFGKTFLIPARISISSESRIFDFINSTSIPCSILSNSDWRIRLCSKSFSSGGIQIWRSAVFILESIEFDRGKVEQLNKKEAKIIKIYFLIILFKKLIYNYIFTL